MNQTLGLLACCKLNLHCTAGSLVKGSFLTCAGLRLPSLVRTQLQVFRLLRQHGSRADLNRAKVHAGPLDADAHTWAPVWPLHQVAFTYKGTKHIIGTINIRFTCSLSLWYSAGWTKQDTWRCHLGHKEAVMDVFFFTIFLQFTS